MTRRALGPWLAGAVCAVAASHAVAQANADKPYANGFDQALAGVFEARERDWRDGAVVYQVYVDRFAPPADLEAKRALYPAPKKLHLWTDLPTHGRYLPEAKVWSHEIDFWGGDLQSLRGKLDYIQGLGADVVYLNPIDLAYTNHKYDTLDYREVSPEYGTRDDARALARDVHARGMKIDAGRRVQPHGPQRADLQAGRGRSEEPATATGSCSARSTPAARAPGRWPRTCPS